MFTLSRLLRLHAYRTHEYASAGDFLMKMSSNDPVCVLLDISMPGPSAYDLGTSERTVKAHRASVMEKMEVKSLAELIRATDGLVSPNGGDADMER